MRTHTFRKSSIKDVAQRAGVSTTTISYFVNGREDVCAPETGERIRAAIAELHYTPNSLTRGLRRGATHTIGVCLYSPLDPELRYGNTFLERMWRGIVRELDVINYSLLHYPLSVRNGGNSDALLDGRVDGLLFHGVDTERAQWVARAGMPSVMVMLSQDLPEGCGSVYTNEEQTIELALGHLFSLGHRRVAHLAGPARPCPNPDTGLNQMDDVAVLRLSAYTSQMQMRGYYDPALIGYADAWRDVDQTVADILAIWRRLPDPPTAVLCANDSLALSVITAARAMDMAVPEALSVVGIDNSIEARQGPVPLTSVAIPVEQIGRQAVRSLLHLMSGDPVEACRVAVSVTEIVVRDSTAPLRRNPT